MYFRNSTPIDNNEELTKLKRQLEDRNSEIKGLVNKNKLLESSKVPDSTFQNLI